jgi:hypothetical protein
VWRCDKSVREGGGGGGQPPIEVGSPHPQGYAWCPVITAGVHMYPSIPLATESAKVSKRL